MARTRRSKATKVCRNRTISARTTANAANDPGIHLCELLLHAGGRGRQNALTLLREAFHILFGFGHSGRIRNIWNYECLATDIADLPNLPIFPLPLRLGRRHGATP